MIGGKQREERTRPSRLASCFASSGGEEGDGGVGGGWATLPAYLILLLLLLLLLVYIDTCNVLPVRLLVYLSCATLAFASLFS